MIAAAEHYVLPATVGTAAIAAMAAVALAAWVALHLPKRRIGSAKLRAALFIFRVAVGFGALWLTSQLAMRLMLLTTNWPVWPIALLGSAATETLIAFYALERRTVSRRAGLTLAAMRVILMLLVIAMLAQPVLSWDLVEEIQRYVAVLVDESGSMRIADAQRTPADRVRLAEMLSVPAAQRPQKFETVAAVLADVRRELSAVVDELDLLAKAEGGARQRPLQTRRKALNKTFAAACEAAEQQISAMARALDSGFRIDDRIRTDLVNAKAELTVGVRNRLAEAMRITAEDGESQLGRQYEALVKAVRGASESLAKLSQTAAGLADALDEKFLESVPADARGSIDAVAGKTRLELAREVLLHRPVQDPQTGRSGQSLLEQLRDGYKVKLYGFAADCMEVDPAEWVRGGRAEPATAPASAAAGSAPASSPAGSPGPGEKATREHRTDLAGAVEKVMTEMSGKQLAGIVMLVDGRHNAPRRIEPLAGQLGLQKVPVCSIAMAPARPPRDAAMLAVHAPESICEKDKLHVDVEVKLDGLAGQTVQVVLLDAQRQVDSRTVTVPKADSYRTHVALSDEPKAAGLHAYRVQVKGVEDEVFADNNEYPLTVSVTKERTRLLVLEGRPRWEFRYLKNLFADRDQTVALQYVLFEPDRIADWKTRVKVPASASRAEGQVEATECPASLAEWMKFDVIVLGDVPPKSLTAQHVETIRRFITERGGTLVVIAGPTFMPHAYAKTPLEEILPMTFKPSEGPVQGDQKVGYRIALTAEGRQSVIMRQDVDPEKNLEVWNSTPEVFWRHPTAAAKEGTSVLAYAMPASPPEFLRPLPPERASDDELIRQREAQVRQFERSQALLAAHQVGAGRVMMLAFDHTWRLRYRVGDAHHHKFWGQVLRWATADKLPAGTEFVRMGTDKTRYAPGSDVRVRVKIVQPDLTPVVSQNVAVRVFADQTPILRRKLDYVKGSSGMYEGDLDKLPDGVYRIELDAPDADPILAAEKVKKVSTEFSVDPVGGPEMVDLSADRALLGRLANLSGGMVVEPYQAGQILPALGEKSLIRRERKEYRLWDSWPLLALIVLLATCEWVLRKRVGLA